MSTPGIPNVWLVTCKECRSYDIVGPGHPATRLNAETGAHEIHSRDALHARLGHQSEACKTAGPNSDGNLDFSFMSAPAAMAAAQKAGA